MMDFIRMLTKNKTSFIVVLTLLIILTASSSYLIYSVSLLTGIENFMRLIGYIVILIILILLIWYGLVVLKKRTKFHYIIFSVLISVLSVVFLFGGYNINYIYERISNISNTSTTYSSSLVVLKDSEFENLSDITGKIGILNDENSINGYQIPLEIIASEKLENEIIYFNDYIDLIENLLNEDIDGAFLPTNYVVLFSNLEIESLDKLAERTKIIYSLEKSVISNTPVTSRGPKEPFTMLLMGVDSEDENIRASSFNGDALMLITFNPKTFNTTMMSIPRDSYVPITCFANQRKNKITHAAWYGEKCMIETIENFTGIDIDYFFKINFKGVVKIVDSLGGIKVDVPYSFCEQDSDRRFGKHMIYVEKGLQTLNGEEALALSRNRLNHSKICDSKWTQGNRDDIVRGQNQQLVLRGIAEKLKEVRDLDTLYNLLDTISNNMETNMLTNDILSFYNVFKDMLTKNNEADIFDIQRLVLSVYGKTIFDYSMIDGLGMKRALSNVVPYEGSIRDVVQAMRINLELEPQTMIKEFAFDINEPYEEIVIGRGYYNEAGIQLLPNFVGQDKNEAIRYGNNYGKRVNITYVTSENSDDFVGKIIKQDTYAGMDLDYVTSINITVVEEVKVVPQVPEKINCALEENEEVENCLVLNFVDKKIEEFTAWKAKNNYSIIYDVVKVSATDPDYKVDKEGLVVSQSVEAGTSLFDLISSGTVFKVKYMESPSTEEDRENEGENDNDDTGHSDSDDHDLDLDDSVDNE